MGYRKLPTMLPLCLAVFMARDALGLGLGSANLDSKLGQPLFARIPIFGAEGIGSEDVRVSLRSVTDAKTGVEIGSVDTRSISAVGEMNESGTGTIYLRSNRPVEEPYLHFLISVRWPGGELSRAYTLLLDLPENLASDAVNNTQAISTASSIIGARNTSAEVLSTVSNSSNIIRRDSAAQSINADTSFYTSVRGDNLWSISKRVANAKGGNASVWMERLYRNNPKAFIRNNRNLLKERVTLDLFESVVEPESTLAYKDESVGLKQKAEHVLQSTPLEKPLAGAVRAPTVSRRDLEPLAEESTGALTEQQLILQNLNDVRNQVADASASIVAMSEKLVALQAQLESLNLEYARLNSSDSADLVPMSVPTAVQLDGDIMQVTDGMPSDEEIGADLLGAAQTDEIDLTGLIGESETTNSAAQAEFIAASDDQSTLNSDATVNPVIPRQSWTWLWWLLPLFAGALLFLRKRGDKQAVSLVDNSHEDEDSESLSDVNAAVAAHAQAQRALSKDHFNDIFSALDAKTVGARHGVATSPSKTLGQESLAETSSTASHRKTTAELDDIALSSARRAATTSLADIDDDFFADLDEDALLQGGGLEDESEFLALDIPDFDLPDAGESWSLQKPEKGSDTLARVSACIELGDYEGARQILEENIATNDDFDLKMHLLDVYARCGDQDEFESLAAQMEITNSDSGLLGEIESLRDQLKSNVFFLGKGRAD
ncbi:hypothetical protein [Zhongshania sp. BJYM1]|uniref:FimV/HubP-related protein n=1 Tax=Zhongshania aquatica TaxID=2965069 RepID=UPI0022B36124|nr:hypothetical protein [Marortus sp. BJYM1]